ncbi:hypothetical protein HY992_01180 [Candidatus Micrarchaeota archaeon]|nr:hypothetical protein [Candidatus Micrarchaeota archaeon]
MQERLDCFNACCCQQHAEIVKLLLASGANTGARGNKEETAWSVAVRANSPLADLIWIVHRNETLRHGSAGGAFCSAGRRITVSRVKPHSARAAPVRA